MIEVRLLAAWKNLVHNDRKTQCNATVLQTPHVFSDSPGIHSSNQVYGIENFRKNQNVVLAKGNPICGKRVVVKWTVELWSVG